MSASQNWADLIGKEVAYVVLRKGNRLQVIVQPTDRQLRRRGKLRWRVIAAGGGSGSAPFEVAEELREAALDGLAELTRDDGTGR